MAVRWWDGERRGGEGYGGEYVTLGRDYYLVKARLLLGEVEVRPKVILYGVGVARKRLLSEEIKIVLCAMCT